VHDPPVVRVVQGVRDLDRISQRVVQRQNPAALQLRERLSIDQLHRDERNAVTFRDLMNRADVAMGQARGVLRLLDQTDRGAACGWRRGYGFDRDIAPESRIAGPVHFSHTSTANQFHDLVGRETNAGRETRRSRDIDWRFGCKPAGGRRLAKAAR
jgi:hypothetical protein